MNDLISRRAAIDAIEEYSDRLQMVNWKENPGIPYKVHALNWCVNTIRELPSAQPHEWIPVTERLPEYGTEVVTVNKDDEYEINHVIDEEDREWFFGGVVAWMPLPPSYKGDEDE